ncbi:hypothetical protein Pcinc_030995 [Petrolisthes cinctipes]|uniref:Uncharacterized protein n=1 Tax=Petrolisthes cinctipes TaxID=88211 RepID=A0AAE1EWZ9_PETCI|nr:hypothetical protein Pcinc_030995 [Petrolisthes cinctipes]
MVFNFRLSRARRTSENSEKFRIYRQPILTLAHNVTKIGMATVVLHNYLCCKTPEDYRRTEQAARQHQGGNTGNGRQPETTELCKVLHAFGVTLTMVRKK